jgi:ribosomal protein S18 acetylase RimI-like enzyme
MDRSAGHSPTRDEAPFQFVGEREGMTDVTLVPMTGQDLDAFISEEIADRADERVRDGTWSRGEALERAQTELTMVAAWERQAATTERQRLLSAINTTGMHVGWLWVKLGPPGPWWESAFLCQITVARAFRHQGYGRAILSALEELLSIEGIAELCLNVCESNLPATCLYDSAGYETAGRYATMRQLRKRLHGGRLTSNTVARVG